MFNTLPNILIIGCTGNLGSLVLELLHNSNFPIRCAKRLGEPSADPVIIPFEGFRNLQDFNPNIVLNLANYYSQDTSLASIKKMKDAITGVAAAIATENIKWKAKIITISSMLKLDVCFITRNSTNIFKTSKTKTKCISNI
jgi:dTDP-4-dehydrorhamnose reductase